MRLSPCRRFVVVESLHVDRKVLESLVSWAEGRGLRTQDAIQVAICAFNAANDGASRASDRRGPSADPAPASSSRMVARRRLTPKSNDELLSAPAEREHQGGVRLLRSSHRVDADERPLGLRRHHVKAEAP